MQNVMNRIPEAWRDVEGFPGYSVSNYGNVRNDRFDKELVISQNQSGLACVGMMLDGTQQHRSVPLMVLEAHGIKHVNTLFDTPINLDGDRMNNTLWNLMWRPRWYAVKYHRQFRVPYPYPVVSRIIDLDTEVVYRNSMEAAVIHGLLEREVVESIYRRTVAWPTGQKFAIVPD